MAKIAFSKFGLKPNSEIKTITWGGQDIEVIQYLPIQKKLGLIGRVISQAHEQDANYSNPVKIEVYTTLEILFEYTNITFTEKQKEDVPKLYDIVYSSGLWRAVVDAMPTDELDIIMNGIENSIEAIYKYQNSALGIIDLLKGDMETIDNIDVEGMKQSLAEIAESPLIKEIVPLLGLQ
jgi:hypothetical protein